MAKPNPSPQKRPHKAIGGIWTGQSPDSVRPVSGNVRKCPRRENPCSFLDHLILRRGSCRHLSGFVGIWKNSDLRTSGNVRNCPRPGKFVPSHSTRHLPSFPRQTGFRRGGGRIFFCNQAPHLLCLRQILKGCFSLLLPL